MVSTRLFSSSTSLISETTTKRFAQIGFGGLRGNDHKGQTEGYGFEHGRFPCSGQIDKDMIDGTRRDRLTNSRCEGIPLGMERTKLGL